MALVDPNEKENILTNNNCSADEADAVSSDFSDHLVPTTAKTNDEDTGSESFELAFSEKQKRLKPSKLQQKTEKQAKSIEIQIHNPDSNKENEDDGIAIQTEILSDYLRPTNILSKYQNGPPNIDTEEEALEEEEKEWPQSKVELEFNTVTQNFYSSEESQNDEFEFEEKSDFEPIAFRDLYPYLMEEADQNIDFDDIIIEDFRDVSWFEYMKIYILGGCVIALKSAKLTDERNTIFKMAKLKLDLANAVHNRMLQALWMKLTDDTRQCDKTGSHWQQIGFQGSDPSTDIRGSGLFGILQLLYISENYHEIISKIYLLSINDHQNFPLVIVSFTISGIVLRLLRSCLIYTDINTKDSVSDSVNEIYVALFYEFYLNWKNKSRVVTDFDEAHKELERETFLNWKGLMQQLMRGTNERVMGEQKQLIPDFSETEVEFGVSKNAKNSDHLSSKRHNQYEL